MSLYKRQGSHHYWCRFTLGRQRIQQSTGTDDRQKAEEYEQILRARTWRKVKLGERSGTWEQAVKKWASARRVRPSTAHRDKEITEWFSQAMAKLPLSAIDQEVIEAATARLSASRAPSTVNRYLAVLGAVLRTAHSWGWLKILPPLKLQAIESTEPRFITHGQFEALERELPAHLKPIARIAVLTGVRTGNLRELTWGRVDLERAHLWIPAIAAKGKRSIGIPLSPDAVEVFKGIPRVSDYVFTYRGKPLRSRTFGKRAWARACIRAGIEGFRFHDLRHTWASWMMQAGVPAYAIQHLGGWASGAMVARYSHLSPDHMKQYAAMARLRA